jgi:uncharacterized protein with HEPN domain
MDERIRKYLQDILVSIDSIDEYLHAMRSFRLYLKNKAVRRAVERELE